MTAWNEYSAADFDATRADRKAARRAREAAQAGQAGLFFVPTPQRADQPKPGTEEIDGQGGLFGEACDLRL